MSKLTRPSTGVHPADAELDRLRAGLLEREPARRDALQEHLRECRACRERAGLWSRVVETLDRFADEPGIMSRISARRQRALRGHATRARRHAPLALALAAAMAAVAIGLGVYLSHDRGDPETPAIATGEQTDLYADIDFYLWLMEQKANEDRSNS